MRLKEYHALYEVVKNERNRYVALTQESMQAQAEMREKIKILENEVDILRNESLAKDGALAKEALIQQQACNTRDQLRLETNKSHAIYRQKQELVEQQIVEIEKLNSVINQLEGEMLRLKSQYELAVENRNFMGAQHNIRIACITRCHAVSSFSPFFCSLYPFRVCRFTTDREK